MLVVGEGENVTLDASASYDPDLSKDEAKYEWECYNSDKDPCFVPDVGGKQKRMIIPSKMITEIDVERDLETNSE